LVKRSRKIKSGKLRPEMKLFSYLSLRQWLTLPYIVLIVLLTIIIAGLSYLTGRDAVQSVTTQLLAEKVERIEQAITAHISGSASVLDVAFPAQVSAPNQIDGALSQLRARFWIATDIHRDPNNYVYFGNNLGQFYGLFRLNANQAQIRQKLVASQPRQLIDAIGSDGETGTPIEEKKQYDVVQRPWYQTALKSSGHVWTPVYVDFSSRELETTRAKAVVDAKGVFQGVVATDLSLKKINDFVQKLSVSPHGIAFVFERDGSLIASSRNANTGVGTDGAPMRISASQSEDPLLRMAYSHIQQKLSDSVAQVKQTPQSFTAPNGDAVDFEYGHIRDEGRLNWIVAVAAPRSDFISGVSQSVTRAALIGLAAALLALFIGLAILRWIARDLQSLTAAARSVGEGHLETKLSIQRKDEIGTLAHAFSQMQQRLVTDQLTHLVNRDMIERVINARIAQARRASDLLSFAVFFVDVNHFKLINDYLGHQAGDAALVEIASRLRASIRVGDYAARYAGDEFVLLMDNIASKQAAIGIRATLEAALAKPLQSIDLSKIEGGQAISAAVGLAFYPDAGDSAAAMVRSADADMYERKRLSRA
jgi:diguanylate cyclase (GGDEF)-like protein